MMNQNKETSSRNPNLESMALFYDDGFWDIFLGALFIGAALYALSGSMAAYLFSLGGLLILVIGRIAITQPRAPKPAAEFSHKIKQSFLLGLLVIIMLMLSAMWLLPAQGLLSEPTSTAIISSLMVPLMLFYFAYLINFKRLYGYAFLVAIFTFTGQFISPSAGDWTQLLAGLLIMTIGFIHLNRFLKYNALPR